MAFDLYVMTGLPRDVGAVRLRYVYEDHVADAARSQNHRRLLELSQAFDALPRSVRLAMYPSTAAHATPAAASPPPRRVASNRRRKAKRPRREQPVACPTNPWRQPVSRWTAATAFLVVGILSAVQFVRATHHASGTATILTTAQTQVDAHAVALQLDRDNRRDDITCRSTGLPSTNQLTCEASDGRTWSVRVYAPPDQFTAAVTRQSVYADSARVDLQIAVRGVQMCRHVSGALPRAATGQVGRARFKCGSGLSAVYLHPGNRLHYHRISRTAYTITVTASNGEQAGYNSTTGKTTP